MRTILKFILIILFALAIFYSREEIFSLFNKKNNISEIKSDSGLEASVIASEEISAPAPLRVSSEHLGGEIASLSAEGIIKYSNSQRTKDNLAPLSLSPKLSESAYLKLMDMESKQYFDHFNSEEKGIKELGAEVGYSYITMGENLAYGDFQNDASLVEAWMESPTHRANILNPKYEEIGIAAKKANFKGKETWIIVQHFGKPLGKCKEADLAIKTKIEESKNRLNELSEELNLSERGAAAVILAYITNRGKVSEYQNLVSQTKNLVEEYNSQVLSFNNCIK